MGPDGTYACLEEGAFYADDLDARQLEVLRQYVREKNRNTNERSIEA